MVERERLHGRQRDPRDTGTHSVKASCELYGPRPVITAAPARDASAIASGSASPRASAKQSVAANESPAPYVSTTGPLSGGDGNRSPFATQPRAPSVRTTVAASTPPS